MGRHIVLALRVMHVEPSSFGRELAEEGLEIGPDIGIRILLNEERSRCMAAEDREEPRRDVLRAKPGEDGGRDLDETLATRRDFQTVRGLAHVQIMMALASAGSKGCGGRALQISPS